MSTSHAMEVPAIVLVALRGYLGQAEIDAIIKTGGPLTESDRQALELGLQWWREQHAVSRHRMQAITARLADSGP